MTVPLTTRGIICQSSSQAISINSWGFLCFDIEPFLEEDVGFIIPDLGKVKELVYNKQTPPLVDPQGELFIIPELALTGQKRPILGSSKSSIVKSKTPALFNKEAIQLTGTKVLKTVGKRAVLLSEPEEPTLTSSGTSVPDLFNKC